MVFKANQNSGEASSNGKKQKSETARREAASRKARLALFSPTNSRSPNQFVDLFSSSETQEALSA